MSDIRAGDVVVRVAVEHSTCPADMPCGSRRDFLNDIPETAIGRCYEVLRLTPPDYLGDCPGLRLRGLSRGPYCIGLFRKVEAADEQFSERIRKCRPVPAKVEETALDRLAARLGEGRISAEVANSLREVTDRDAAYGRMIEASIARDDAGYERAKAEFWGMAR